MTIFRLPFDDDGAWQLVPQGNWDDPATSAHQPYAFDFAHPVGGNVRAARGGVVIFVENNDGNLPNGDKVPGYGTAILIRHIDDTISYYNHLKFQSTKVVCEQYVLQGQVIGLSGNTGQSSAPHLHFGVNTFWNNAANMGTEFPVQFEDKNHVAWRPFIGDALASNNSTLRQEDWRWCSKCQGLFFNGKPSSGLTGGKCPSGGSHSPAGSANYLLVLNSSAPGQAGWRWCSKCQGLFFAGNPGSTCPAGGAHTSTGSGDYVLAHNAPTAPGQPDWRWCSKCQGLFFGGNPGSNCPAGGEHSKAGSGNYTLMTMGPGDPQQNWRHCNKCQGLYFAGKPGSQCPAGGEHSNTGSGNYVLVHDYLSKNAPGQADWRWCNKCQGLFFGGNSSSHCPTGGSHSKTGSGNYTVVQNSPKAPGQADWRWCSKCQGMFFAGGGASHCPAGGAHIKIGSGNYSLLL